MIVTDWLGAILTALVILNTIAAVITVFRDKNRDITAVWAWLLVLTLFPVVGFLIYFFFGRKLSNRRIFDLRTQEAMGIDKIASNQKLLVDEVETQNEFADERAFIRLFLNNDEAILTQQNAVTTFTDGQTLFDKMFADIAAAVHHINIEFYTIYDDELGNRLIDLLTKKATEGVRVRVIFDVWGSGGRHNDMYRRLREAGGQVEGFLMPRWMPFSLRVNNHNHRKLVVVDGNIGFIGGFNIGDQYLGKKKKFGHWRDTHLRVEGDAVLAMQSRFFMDWNATTVEEKLSFSPEYFPSTPVHGNTAMQIVSSGPESDAKQIYQGYLRMISMARKEITIQSPYFIPNQAIMESLEVAARSGVKVRIMIPDKPDHAFVYRATEYYSHTLAKAGVAVYAYHNGFIHAKTMVIDGKVASVGSANMDIRSYSLNFEVNAFMYDHKMAAELTEIFDRDIAESLLLDEAYFDNQSHWTKFKQMFSRLLAPIL
jgi:cardiolipin synthase